MARKSAALLKSTPVRLDKLSKDFLATLRKQTPVAGCEEAWERYLLAADEYEKAYTKAGSVFEQVEKEGGHSACKSWATYVEAQRTADRAMSAVFGALDHYQFAVRHVDDKKGVAEDELRAVIIDSLSDKLKGLKFNVNSGILSSAIARAIRKDTSEHEMEAAFCQDCQ